jgi:peptidoglycan/LPS O-acetylase OafA/YrhL
VQNDSPRLRANNFDLLRLLLAGTVCLVHVQALSGFSELAPMTRFLSAGVAVKAFFVVSGFLIFMSYERSSSLRAYALKRVRRIYPAYFTVVMLCAMGLVAVSSLTVADYFSSAWVKYVVANLLFLNFLHPTLPGVFDANTVPEVNGALWTLKIEVMFYLSVPLFVLLFRRFSHFSVIVVTYCASVAYLLLMTSLAESTGSESYLRLGRQLPGQLSYFMSGAFFYYFLPLFERKSVHFLVLAAIALVLNSWYPIALFEPFALATLVAFFGLFLHLGNFGKYGDFSYGVYIVHVPIIQLLLLSGHFSERPWALMGASVFLTGVCAIAMWHLVEKRFLFRSSHYIVAVSADGVAQRT